MRTLHSRFFALTAVVACVVGIVALMLQSEQSTRVRETVTQALNLTLARRLASEAMSAGGGPAEVRTAFGRLMAINPSIDMYWVASDGRIQAVDAPPGAVTATHVDTAPIRAFVSDRFDFPLRGDDPKRDGVRKVFSAAPFDPARPELGWLYIVLSGAAEDAVVGRMGGEDFGVTALIAAAAATAVGLCVAFVALRWLTRPLRQLADSMDRMVAENFSAPRPVTVARGGGAEIDRLVAAYHRMGEQIIVQLLRLAREDAARRDLIAALSHDLRSPLGVLRAHLDALATAAENTRERFVGVASRQAEIIHHMVERMFELATLEEIGAPATYEMLNPAELVQDVAQKFAPLAAMRGVRLIAEPRPETPTMRGDVALLERLLDNLVENALRHTPADGTVTLTAAPDPAGLMIDVADTGEGIALELLPGLLDGGMRRASGGVGLGLAISRRIAELHGGTIDVKSVPGAGTRVVVRLPAGTAT